MNKFKLTLLSSLTLASVMAGGQVFAVNNDADTGGGQVAWGTGFSASGGQSIAVGNNSMAATGGSVVIGNGAFGGGDNGTSSVSIGSLAHAYGNFSIAIGALANVGLVTPESDDAPAVRVKYRNAIALGTLATVNVNEGTALGDSSSVTATSGIALGRASVAERSGGTFGDGMTAAYLVRREERYWFNLEIKSGCGFGRIVNHISSDYGCCSWISR